ncbi:MAG: ABC transporter permease [Lachnospiraceae bacterium]|nr:ABC transporter permease [Lachnospiraceae bacterium]
MRSADQNSEGGSRSKYGKSRAFVSKYGIVIAFVILCLILSISTKGRFLVIDNVLNVLRQVSINGVLAIGMTFVILTGGIDLSVGAVVALTGFVCANVYKAGWGLLAVFVLTILCGGLIGLVNGYFVANHSLAPFIVTLGVQTMARGFTYIYSDGKPVSKFEGNFVEIGKSSFLGVPVLVWILVITFLVSCFILYKTKMGRYVFAVGGNLNAALYSGVKTKRVLRFAYVYCGLMSGLAAVMLTSRVSAALPQAGQAYESDAIAAVVIGGTSLSGGKGRLWGTIVGVLLIGVITNGLDLLSVSSYIQQVVKGAIIIGAILFDRFTNHANG